VEQARDGALGLQQWDHEEHTPSALKFVTPAERPRGEDEAGLARRRTVYETARLRPPERWSGRLRHGEAPQEVWLNPPKQGHPLTRVTPM
jgi:hypothetical protein